MFHYDGGLKLTRPDLAIDFRRRQPRGFISHGHMDHMARHVLALCTPDTAAFYRLRLGPRDAFEIPFHTPTEWGGVRLTTLPAGHCLGSAMLLAEQDGERLLYTGDFKLGKPLTAEPAVLVRADVLVMESTFGDPRYRWRPRDEVLGDLVELVRRILARGGLPVVEAYSLGKAQEVSCALARAGYRVQMERGVFEVSTLYRERGVSLGDCELLGSAPERGCVIVAPPRWGARGAIAGLGGVERIGVTGWAADRRTRRWVSTDHALPLSDHADFHELMTAIEQIAPRVVYCTHGPASFVEHVRAAGFTAHRLGGPARPAGT